MSVSLIVPFQVQPTQNEEYSDVTSLGIIWLVSCRRLVAGEGMVAR